MAWYPDGLMAGPWRPLRRWLAGWTLRTRLISGLAALMLAACAAISIITYMRLHGFLVAQLDEQLAAASSRYQMCMSAPQPAGRAPDAQACADTAGQAASTFSARIAHAALAGYITNGRCHLTAAERAALLRLPVGGPPVTEQLPTIGTDYRLMAVRGLHGDILITGLPMNPVTSTLDDVALTEIVVFAAAVALTGVLGTAWVRLSLRPLQRVTATAAQVARLPLAREADLPHRAPDSGSRTEVGQLASAFNQMLGHVEEAIGRRHASEERLRTFAADASHELRTPLAAIRGYAELAQLHSGTLPAEVAHALSRVRSESERMSALVEDLLLLARLDAGRQLVSEPVDMARLAIDAVSDAQAAGPAHQWRLQLPEHPVMVAGDSQRLHQALSNLLSNARAHTPDGTMVTVALTAAPGAAELRVTDNGPGIPRELQPAVFERFTRGDSSRSRAAGGTGLGLSIVAAVVAAHHGTASVTSWPGCTVFLVTVPLLPAPSPAPAAEPVSTS